MTSTYTGDGRSVTRLLSVSEGRIAYDLQGTGPLVLLVPGVGELRSAYRFLVPHLVKAGYTAVSVDLRGHGESDASFATYGDVATASDLAALIRALGAPAVVVGNSLAAGAAVIVAAEAPDLISGLVLVGPFVRDPASSTPATRLLLRILMAPLWAATSWNAYLPKLYAGTRPADFTAYRESAVAAIKRPGHSRAFSRTIRTDHARAAESLSSVDAPTLVVMGDRDPDFKDPQAEATWIAGTLNGDAVMITDAGHYPHAQQPEQTAAAVVPFLDRITTRA